MTKLTKIGGISIAVLLLAGISSFFVGSNLEQNNAFCQSCHVHNDIYARFMAERKNIEDLAGEHRVGSKNKVRCIDCHREPGTSGHLLSFSRAGVALARYVTKTYDVPIKAAVPPSSGACRQCHSSKAKGEMHLQGHYHELATITKGEKIMGATLYCSTCHSAHDPSGKKNRWVSHQDSDRMCDKCHKAMKVEDVVRQKEAELKLSGAEGS